LGPVIERAIDIGGSVANTIDYGAIQIAGATSSTARRLQRAVQSVWHKDTIGFLLLVMGAATQLFQEVRIA